MAEIIKEKLGIEPELTEGKRGEFTVWVEGEKVAEKGWFRFPSDEKILTAVRQVLADD